MSGPLKCFRSNKLAADYENDFDEVEKTDDEKSISEKKKKRTIQ